MNHCFHQRRGERGYILLILLLTVALLSFAFLETIEGIEFQIRRDREEEMIHRGLEYSRAVRRYVKQFGRYPNNIEELENTNHIRFLRKRYKDPVTGKDFKILHYGDLQAFYANPPAIQPANSAPPTPADGQTGADPSPESSQRGAVSDAKSSPATDSTGAPQADPNAPNAPSSPATHPLGQNQSAVATGDGGGPAVIGVTSYSSKRTIRVFNKKDHYNQWQFVYDPSTDTGLMKGPNQPLSRAAGNAQPLQNGQGAPQGPGMNQQGIPQGSGMNQAQN